MNFRVLRCVIWVTALSFSTTIASAREDTSAPTSDSSTSQRSGGTKADYVLQPQDVVRIQVFQVEDINKQGDGLSLSQDSSVTLPLIGTVNLKGKTVRQAEEMIRDLYDKDYIVNPQVTLTVVKYSERSVNVVGSVTNQGRIPFPQERGLSIIDAISLAGGQTRFADLKKVKLTRKNSAGDAETIEVNVDVMMKKGGTDAVMLQPDDVVFVPERII